VQVDAIEPTLKAPGTKRLKLIYDEPPSKFAFKFNLRRHTEGQKAVAVLLQPFQKTPLADEYPAVGRCTFTPA